MAQISKSRLGTVGEYYAIQWLLNQGHQVFYNVHNTGPIDIVILKNNKLIPIDVKVESHRKNKKLYKGSKTRVYRVATKLQKKLGVLILNVDLQGKCYFNNSVKDN
jgi:Holliday junction resolvase-like predicted endonuclease